MADLPPLDYGKVVGRFLANVIDGPDLGDLPEFPPLTGTITFAADAPKVLVRDAQPAPATYVQLPQHYECQLDEFGYLTWRGKRGVRLVAPGAATNPTEWTWRVSFDLSYDGERIPMDPFSFHVPRYVAGPDPENPDVGSTGLVDLTLAAPVPTTSGNAVVVGPAGHGIQIDGQSETYGQLPSSPPDGSQYIVKTDGLLYIYRVGTGWTANGQGIVVRGPAGTTLWSGISGKPTTFAPIIGDSATTAVAGDDPRLSNARTPVSHTHPIGQVTGTSATVGTLLGAADAAAVRTVIAAVSDTDSRLTNARTPTAAGQVYDIAVKSHIGSRVVGAGNTIPEGLRIERALTVSKVTYRGETAGTGNLIVELRKNGVAVAGSSATIAAANHALDSSVTGSWSFAAGDRVTVHVTTADSPAGKGLQASLAGVTV